MLAKKNNKHFKDVQTQKRVHEHLSNEKDIISSEDIGNVKIDVTEGEEAGSNVIDEKHPSPETEDMERPLKKTGRSDDPGIGTSWNILDT